MKYLPLIGIMVLVLSGIWIESKAKPFVVKPKTVNIFVNKYDDDRYTKSQLDKHISEGYSYSHFIDITPWTKLIIFEKK